MNGIRAIFSVYDKTGIVSLAQSIISCGGVIYSSGGTFRYLQEHLTTRDMGKSSLIRISDFTGAPEILGGRVKTLHPKIYGGILARDDQLPELQELDIPKIDLVVCNLYPFFDKQTIENIDIGGVSLIRAAGKNYQNTTVLTRPDQYPDYEVFLKENSARKALAADAFRYVTAYDAAITNFLMDEPEEGTGGTGGPHTIVKIYQQQFPLKYGLNPYQGSAGMYSEYGTELPYTVLNGTLGYINALDAIYGWSLALELSKGVGTSCTSYKHNSPAGVAHGDTPLEAFQRCRNCDPKSSFGDFMAINTIVDLECAEAIKKVVSDGIIAPGYSPEALTVLSKKKKGKYVILQGRNETGTSGRLEIRDMHGMCLVQEANCESLDELSPTERLGMITLKYTQSNSVCMVYQDQVIGIGAGQQSRVDCVKLAGEKAREWFTRNAVEMGGITMASDAFFPFPDSIHVAKEYGVTHVVQPGGSVRDEQVWQAVREHNMTMTMCDKRMFLH